jgi:urease accessory protein
VPTVHLVGGAAGPVGGDHWRLEVVVGPGAALRFRSVAASIAFPDREGNASLLEVVAEVGAGGVLDWAPEPMILAAGADHSTRVTLRAADDSRIRWREEVVCGRADEAGGTGHMSLRATYADRPLLAHDVAVGAGAPGWDTPAVLGPARAFGTVLIAGPGTDTTSVSIPVGTYGVRAAVASLSGPGRLVTAVGPDAAAIRRALDFLAPDTTCLASTAPTH